MKITLDNNIDNHIALRKHIHSGAFEISKSDLGCINFLELPPPVDTKKMCQLLRPAVSCPFDAEIQTGAHPPEFPLTGLVDHAHVTHVRAKATHNIRCPHRVGNPSLIFWQSVEVHSSGNRRRFADHSAPRVCNRHRTRMYTCTVNMKQ